MTRILRLFQLFFYIISLGGIFGCTETRVRKEIRDLSPEELNRFHSAIKTLNKRTHGQVLSNWDLISNLHLANVPFAHGLPAFLPWHRYFVWYVETTLRNIDPSITIPYWDWSIDSQAPERSIVFSDAYFGGNGDASSTNCLKSGPYANWQVSIPQSHCLARDFDGGSKISSFVSPVILAMIISKANDYDAFRQTIESTPHAAPHLNIGGDMKTMYSPNDPLFFLHHAYVDKLWHSFQTKNDSAFMFAFDSEYNLNLNSSSIMQPFNISVAEVLDISKLCYRYQESTSNRIVNLPVSNQVGSVSNPNPVLSNSEASVSSVTNGFTNMVSETTSVSKFDFSATYLLSSNGSLISSSIFSSNETAVVVAENILLAIVGSSQAVPQMKTPNFLEKLFNVDMNVIKDRNPGPLDREDNYKMRLTQPIKEEYIKHMGLNLNAIRNIEDALASLYDLSNNG